MLHNKLKQLLNEHTANEQAEVLLSDTLFEKISEVFTNSEEENRRLTDELAIKLILLKEYKTDYLKKQEINNQVANRLKNILEKISKSQKLSLTEQASEIPAIESLISDIEVSFKLYFEKNEVNEKRLRELESINKELDQFAYIVSHDLKAPLRAISNLSQWIEDDISNLLNAETRSNFELLRNRVFRLENLINAILTYSKSTKQKNKTEISDSGCLLEEVIDSLNCPENISIDVNGKFPVFETESVKLQQVFSNLIGNAIKYNDKEKGKIEIGFFEGEDFIQFYVKDNGPGIEPQFQKKVFMIFQTLEVRDDIDSTGIGLAIVKKIVEEKGGKIWIESDKGQGSKFVFLWPKVKNDILIKI